MIFLWKNFIVVSAAFTASWLIIRQACDGGAERRHLDRLFIAALFLTALAFSRLPIIPTLLLVSVCIVGGASAGTPLLSSYIVMTAIIPVFSILVPGAFGISTLVDLRTPLVAGLTVLIMRVAAPAKLPGRGWRAADLLIVAFIVAQAILTTRGQSAQLIIRVLIEYLITYGGAYLVASRTRLSNPAFFLKSLLFVGSALGLIAAFEALRWWPQYLAIYEIKNVHLARPLIARAGFMRSGGPFDDPLAFSIFLATTATAGMGLLQGGRHRASIYLAVACIAAGIAGTFSRTGMVALGLALLVMAVVRRKLSSFFVMAVAGSIGLLFLNFISGSDTEGTSSYRLEILQGGIEVVRKNLIFGNNQAIRQGEMSDLVQGQGIVDVVNSYLQVAMDGGLFLLACFLAVPLAGVLRYARFRPARGTSARLLADVALAQTLGILGALLVTSLTDKNLLYVVLLSGLLLGSLQRSESPRKPVPDSSSIPAPFANMRNEGEEEQEAIPLR